MDKNIVNYCFKYYIFNDICREQKLKNVKKIHLLNNFFLLYKIYLTIIKNKIRKYGKFIKNEIFLKIMQGNKTLIHTKQKKISYFIIIRFYFFYFENEIKISKLIQPYVRNTDMMK